ARFLISNTGSFPTPLLSSEVSLQPEASSGTFSTFPEGDIDAPEDPWPPERKPKGEEAPRQGAPYDPSPEGALPV
ncbi:MAG: hypothetical protein ACE5KK_03210, partial [Candidatus Brocadiales bacterium]